jgi:hypothetical protein
MNMNLAAIFPWRPSRRRADARRRIAGLRCSMGEVLDFSRRGLKVASARKPELTKGMTIPVLVGSPTRGVGVVATVAWIRQDKKAGAWHIGLRIEDQGPDLLMAVSRFAPERPARPPAPAKKPRKSRKTAPRSMAA